MALVIRIRNTESGAAPQEATLPAAGGTLGRDASCAVVLADPTKHVSRQHLRIELQEGRYRLSVLSRVNPAELNGTPLRFGESSPLSPGDRITVLPYEVEVLSSTPGTAAPPLPSADQAPTHAALFDSFPWTEGPESRGAPEEDIFNLGALARPAVPRPTSPDPFSRPAAPRQTGPLGDIPGLTSDPAKLPGQTENQTLDPLKAIDSLGAAPSDELDALGIRAAPLVDLGGHGRRGTPSLDHVHDINLPFGNPTPPPPPPRPSPPMGPAAQTAAASGRTDRDPLDQLLDDLARQAPTTPGRDASIPPFEFQIPTPRGGPPPPSAALAPALEELLKEPTAPAAPGPAGPGPRPVPVADAGSAATGLDRFLAGLGIPREALKLDSDDESLELAGRIVRVAVESIIAFLLSRSVVKKELRAADRTMLASRDNNPLKVMENTDEALRFLFDTSEERLRAFKAPVPALQDACDDILAHELALLAGCRAAVIAAFRKFDPALIEKQTEKSGLLGAINRRAQLWDGYVAQYEKIQAELTDQVEKVLSRDFMKEYANQVAKFKRGQRSEP